ncbi:NAD(P)H-binding protein [Catenulispora sp. NF23]|uniref:NmrA family NAD(P)-binding protein n=1 Tax=Catenulispora pinistramenti TaxID=2705254 RepID=UPI001BA7F252|nr:NAD(P)H-binding protein [Catenulispora pinistramenti]MBS2539377.1 NAD(P)H-binding protein [Catenulispora pinistramenti]
MIVVTTPTGRIGRRVVELLLAATDPASVRGVTRDPAALDPRVRAAVQVVAGSHRDPAALDRAFDGADSVFWLVPPDPRAPGTATDHYLGFAAPACEALAKRRVRRVVAVTSLGHGYPHDAGTLSAAFAMDAAFQHSGVGYRGLAAPFFLENLFSQTASIRDNGEFAMALAADRPLAAVASADIATLAASVLLDPAWTDQAVVPVTCPEDLTPDRMAAIMSEVLGRPVRYRQNTVDAFHKMLLGFGVSAGWAQGVADMVRAQNDGIYDVEPHLPPTHVPHLSQPTAFRTWCEQQLKPAVDAA